MQRHQYQENHFWKSFYLLCIFLCGFFGILLGGKIYLAQDAVRIQGVPKKTGILVQWAIEGTRSGVKTKVG